MNADHQRFESFLLSIEDGLPKYLKDLEMMSIENGIPIIRKGSQRVIKFMLALKRPLNILEVGTATGFSSLFMSEFSDDECRITTIERMRERADEAALNFKKYDKKNKISLIIGNAEEILKELSEKTPKSCDFVFMDAAKGQYGSFCPYVKRLMREGAILISDNMLQEGSLLDAQATVIRRDRTIHKRMREYVKMLCTDKDFETMLLEEGDGMSVSVKKCWNGKFDGK